MTAPTVEPAGVSEERLRELRTQHSEWAEYYSRFPGNPFPDVKRHQDHVAAFDELLAFRDAEKQRTDDIYSAHQQNELLRQQLAEMRGALERVEREMRRMVGNKHDVPHYQVVIMHGWCVEALSTVTKKCRACVGGIETVDGGPEHGPHHIPCRKCQCQCGADGVGDWACPIHTLAPTSQPSRGKCEPANDRVQCMTCEDGNLLVGPCPDCAQPERQGADKFPADYNGRELYDFAPKKRPSPPQDDIVAGLRRLLSDFDNSIIKDEHGITERDREDICVIMSAIAALGEKGAK